MQSLFAISCLFVLSTTTLQAALDVTTSDIINSPDYFAGFESLPDSITYGSSYTENNIQIRQVNGDGNDISTNASGRPGAEGQRWWYPNGGDHGYTQIMLADGGDFESIGLLRGSGGLDRTIMFQLLNNGVILWTSRLTSAHLGSDMLYIGFTGGGFDEVRLRDIKDEDLPGSFSDGTANALRIDAIEVTIPAAAHAPVLNFEEPIDGGISNGIANVRGWVVSDSAVTRIDLYVDGELLGAIPHGGIRPLVGDAFPTFPNSDESGFSMAYGFSNFTRGTHTMKVEVYDAGGLIAEKTNTFFVSPFDSAFIGPLAPINLSGASFIRPEPGDSTMFLKRFRMNNAVLDGVSYDVLFEWNSATQSFEIIDLF